VVRGKSRFAKLIGYSSPGFFSAKQTFKAYWPQFRKMILLSGWSTLFEAIGFALLYRVVLIITEDSVKSLTELSVVNILADSALGVAIACAVFLALSVKTKHLIAQSTITISENSGCYAGELALIRARDIATNDSNTVRSPTFYKALVLFATKDVPYACGFAARAICFVTFNLIQAGILTLVLVYLSPLLTTIVLSSALLLIAYLSISFETAVKSNILRKEKFAEYKREVEELAASMSDPLCSDIEFSKITRSVITEGEGRKQFSARLSERQERQTGSLVIGYVYPIAILGVALMYTYLGDLAPSLTETALYLLIMRQVSISLFAIGNSFMSLSKHHRTLKSFFDLIDAGILQGAFDNQEDPALSSP